MAPIEDVEIGAHPALVRGEQHPPARGRHRDGVDVFLRPGFAEHELVSRRVLAKMMEADAAVVVLVAGRDGARSGMAAVVEAAIDPRDGRALRVRDALAEIAAGRDFGDPERRELVAAARESVRDVARVRRRVVPVQRHQARSVEGVRIDEGPFRSVRLIADVEDRLLLVALASRVEQLARDRSRCGEEPDREELA